MSNVFLDAAIEYASKGMAVFPLKPRAKEPLTRHGVKDATTNFNTIESWWTKHPNANIGIACGMKSGGLLVIDLDEKPNGISGSDTLHNWERENGSLPETVRSITGKGGAHILYRIDHVEKNKVNLLEGVDIRSDDGYIVAPPSIHPNGRTYEWEYDPEEYDIATADETVMKLLSVGKKPALDKFTVSETIPDGKRNETIYKLACSLQAKGLGDGSILAACLSENESKCNPPLDSDEVEKIVGSALHHDKGTKAYPAAAVHLDLLTVTDSKGNEKVRQCAENVARVILNDPMLSGKIKEDAFGHRLMYLGQLNWRRDGDNYGEWTDKDDGALESYLDIKYGLRNKNDYTNGFNMALLENEFNPLQSYLDALEWDGVPRIDEALHRYLGVEKTEYNLAAFRVFLQGAIHRAYNPGCKFDYMMVLIGKQGDGKSTLFKFLACNDDWYDENFNFKDTNNKTTVEKMAGKWFLEMGEMDTMKKDMVTSDALKAFVSSVSDDYRVPFAKRKETRKRQCVFCGTSNDINFLKDRTGNRRYLPIDCNATSATRHRIFDYDTARPYFQQVIAEAVAEYKADPNKKPVLPFDIEEQAKREQLNHLEEDVWVSIIQDHLDNELVGRVNAAYIYDKAFGKDPVDMRKGEAGRILTIMRNDIVGWHEIGKARLTGYGKRGICFERDQVSPNEDEGSTKVAVGGGKTGFVEVEDDEVIPF
jgi:predicted P-loop ATPase